MPRRWTAVRKATQHGVSLVRNATPVSISDTAVRYRVGDEEVEVPADHVIVASYVEPDTALADTLRSNGFEVRVAGDAVDVGYIEGAMHSAHAVAREIR